MKKFLSGLSIFLVVLLLGLFFNFLSGVIWPAKAVYEVTSKTSEGINFVSEYKVKFLPNRVVGTFWTDFYISESGHYAFDYEEDKINDRFSYRDLDDKFVQAYRLTPKYSWWQSNGLYVILFIGFVVSLFGEGLWNIIFSILDMAS